ncbi:MAG: murE [Acidimicrobiia bacterium]|nr:murE [Acidimicrobiia bacterium]
MNEAGIGPEALRGEGSVEVADLTLNSRAVEPGWLFCAVPGSRVDGHDFVDQALERGASALLVERPLDRDVPQVVVPSSRLAMAPVASALFGHPSRQMTVVAVTGTNGKTTVAYLLASIWRAAGINAGVIGTLSGERTTPESCDLQRRLAGWRDQGATAVALEATSIGLLQHRVDAVDVDVAVFTNLSRDHLDVHGTMERYFAAKALLFEPARSRRAVVNLDDRYGQLLTDAAQIPTVGYSLAEAESLEVGALQSSFVWRGQQVVLPLGGRFNVSNALAAATAAAETGVDIAAIAAGLRTVEQIPGRFEPVIAGQPFLVLVDFAHTPDGLEEVLKTVRQARPGARVSVVFGCGGDRDASKRPAMGEIASRLADVAVITSDNPRSEPPDAIIAAVQSGTVSHQSSTVLIEPDRRAAIALALARAEPGDVVVIAGKGHETTQTIGSEVVQFDDRVVAAAELGKLGWMGPT